MKQRIVRPQWAMFNNFLLNTNAIAFVEKADSNLLEIHMLTGDVISTEYTGKNDPLTIYAKFLEGNLNDENS